MKILKIFSLVAVVSFLGAGHLMAQGTSKTVIGPQDLKPAQIAAMKACDKAFVAKFRTQADLNKYLQSTAGTLGTCPLPGEPPLTDEVKCVGQITERCCHYIWGYNVDFCYTIVNVTIQD
jgi:hypothetical protein